MSSFRQALAPDPHKRYTLPEFHTWAVDLAHLGPSSMDRFVADFARTWPAPGTEARTLIEWLDEVQRWIHRT